MIYQLYKFQIAVGALITILLLWALTVTIMLGIKEEKILVVGIDGETSRVISNSEDMLLKKEVTGFLRLFLESLYNFNAQTFSDNVGRASELMSEELWEKEKEKLILLKSRIAEFEISQTGLLQKIIRVSNDEYKAVLDLRIKERLKEEKQALEIVLRLKRVERSGSNPWGFVVKEVNEKKL